MMKSAGWYTLDEREAGSAVVRVKAVPGSRREEIAGVLGDRLKVRVSAPPEKGKANDAIVELVTGARGVPGPALGGRPGGHGRRGSVGWARGRGEWVG
ncbi:MAG: DUF167 domain-containing protein, partial [Phycisphaerales bacterium]|nr:DUF167 domain-containing protein [Phycisphaerales bacterium]